MIEKKEKKSVIILAAGDGSRLKSTTPKVFHKIGGLALVDHVIKTSKDIQADEIVAVLKPKYKDFQSAVCNSIKKAFQAIPSGTGDTVKFGLEQLSKSEEGWVYVLYGDIPLVSAESLLAMHELAMDYKDTAVVVLAFNPGANHNLGKLEPADKPGTIRRIVEAKDTNKNDDLIPLCNAGLLIRRDVLNKLLYKIQPSQITNEVYITEIVRLAYESGFDCRYYEASKEELSGVNTRQEMAFLEACFQEKMRLKFMDNGVTLVAPETVFFSYDTDIEKDVTIYPYVVFGENVKLKSGAEVGPFCVVEGTTIHQATIGPFSRLRPGSEIHSGAKIGNFVEIKKSKIKEKAKVNHLTYIGDSTIGQNTNIGAGTITCNYDGFQKFHTEIGDNVFIGSNTALVAPVTVEDGAMIGAGSVITRDVNAQALSIARGTQRNIENWAHQFRKSKGKN